MIAPPSRGPWRPGLPHGERVAQLRALRALARVLAGPASAGLCEALRAAEGDPAALERAAAELARLPTVPMRRLLASFAALDDVPKERRTRGAGRVKGASDV